MYYYLLQIKRKLVMLIILLVHKSIYNQTYQIRHPIHSRMRSGTSADSDRSRLKLATLHLTLLYFNP